MTTSYVCTKCDQDLPIGSFACKVNGARTLRCITCLKEDGSDICQHDLIKDLCGECSELCEHRREITTCKLCCDPIPIIVRNMVNLNLIRDKQKGIYDSATCVDEEHVLELILKAQGICYYCKCSMQYQTYADDLASLERLSNSLGHIKGNCVIACLKCNRSQVGQRPPYEAGRLVDNGALALPTKKRRRSQVEEIEIFL